MPRFLVKLNDRISAKAPLLSERFFCYLNSDEFRFHLANKVGRSEGAVSHGDSGTINRTSANGTRVNQSSALATGVAGGHSHSAGSDLDPLIGHGHVLLNNHSTGHSRSSGRGQGYADNQIAGAILDKSNAVQNASAGSDSLGDINGLNIQIGDQAVAIPLNRAE